MHAFGQRFRDRTGGRYDPDAAFAEHRNDRRSNPLRAAGNERPAVFEFEVKAHRMISKDAILSPLSSNKYRKSTGLPGKFPMRCQVMTVLLSLRSDANGSVEYEY